MRLYALAILTVVFGGAGGCSSPVDAPRDRLGALPFPGMMTLYTPADPADLGRHRYASWPRLIGEDERERGIIYTTRAGFLDLAHVRIAIDHTRFCTRAVRVAIDAGRTEVALPGPDQSVFHVALDYAPGWPGLSAREREQAAAAAARQVGQRVAYLMLTWHEVTTWFGYRTFFLDESRSAFAYDDSVSHLVGMRVAERAMADGARPFDEAVTAELAAELRRLGAVKPEQTDQAARAVEGVWWAGEQPLKRHADVYAGECAGDVLRPWLVARLPFAAGAVAEEFPLPRARCDTTAAVRAAVEIEPRITQAHAMRALLPGKPDRFGDDRDVPALLRAVRAQMLAKYGPEVGVPWPVPGSPPKRGSDVASTPPPAPPGPSVARPLPAAAAVERSPLPVEAARKPRGATARDGKSL